MPATKRSSIGDEAALKDFGKRLEEYRLNRNQTQNQIAEEAGISRRSVYKIEKGESVNITVLIRLLRVYGLLDRLEALVPLPDVSPIALLEAGKKKRRRAAGAHKKPDEKTDDGAWTWHE
jgi:putative transcriptional regulator